MPSPIPLLRDLVAIPSVNPSDGEPDDSLFGEARMVEYLECFFRSQRIDCVRQQARPGRENLIAWVQGKSPQPIILEAHTDTVSVEGMTIAPFGPVLRDGRVYGRGACDDKSSLAAMAAALVRVARAGTPERTCILAATCDEEYRFGGVWRFVEDPGVLGLKSEDLAGAWGCIGEPTNLSVVIAHKGAFRWRLRTHGKAAHSSDPDRGENAILKMAPLLLALEVYAEGLRARPKHPLVGTPTFSVGTIRGGSAVNIVPDLCEVQVDRRLIPGEDGEQAQRELRAALDAVAPCGYELVTLLQDWPMETPREAHIVRRAVAAVEAVLGSATIAGVAYGTDASKLARAGAQCVVCGPGNIAQAHTAEEWVDVAEVEAAVEVYRGLLA